MSEFHAEVRVPVGDEWKNIRFVLDGADSPARAVVIAEETIEAVYPDGILVRVYAVTADG